MKRLLLAAVTAVFTLFAGASAVFAQDGGPPQFRPVEMWVCNYKEDKDSDDFDDAMEKLVESEGEQNYAAWTLNPYFVNPAQDFDLIFLGAWPSGTAMGEAYTNYFANGSDASEAWEEAVDCPASIMYASYEIQPVPESADGADGDGTFILSVADCKVGHAVTNGQALGALERFNDYAVANGLTVATFAWFPVWGSGETEFTFKLAQAFANVQHLGDTFQWFVDTAAYNVNDQMTAGVVSCDAPRIYTGNTVMDNMQ